MSKTRQAYNYGRRTSILNVLSDQTQGPGTGQGTQNGDLGTGPGDPGIGLGVPGTLFIGVKAPLWQPVPRHGVEKQCSGFRRVDVTSRATLHNLHCEFVRGYQPLVRAET